MSKPRIEFGADGIRGVAGKWPFLLPIAVRIGQALGQFVHKRSERPFVVIGRDTRPSGMGLLHCLAAGLMDQGVDVVDLGVMTTPGVAFLTRRLEAALGVIVSASHSPLECNGIKLVTHNGLRLQREEEIEAENLIDKCVSGAIERADAVGQHIDGQNLIKLYVSDHIERCLVESLEGLKVVLDCADGATSRVAPEAFRRLQAEVTVVNDAMERKSINYQCGSEYAREHPLEFAKVVRQHGARCGFAFDGDGDRLVVVDPDGQVFDGNDLLFIMATHFHSQGLLRGDAVVTIRTANRGLKEALHSAGIRTIDTDNGDRNLEAAMWGGDYMLGGEPGGNIIINDGYHTAADAIHCALVLAGILVRNQASGLKEMTNPLQKRPQETVSLKVPDRLTFEQKRSLEEQIQGVSAELGEDSRILFWESSTEPGIVRVMVEGGRGSTLEEVSKATDAIQQFVQNS